MSQKVMAVGLSGGVDSSMAAWKLQQEGHRVIGIYMKNWEDPSQNCPSAQDQADAQAMAQHLGIDFEVVNFCQEYQDEVFSWFLSEHQALRTPNPDILCNRFIKFHHLKNFAKKLGATALATGHYAQRDWDEATQKFCLKIPTDHNKDQTYFLSSLTQEQLAFARFPLSGLTKPEIRAHAQAQGFPTATKPDSTGICFIGEQNYREFLAQYLPPQPGDIVTKDGQIVGQHQGLWFYTIGQRRDLHVGGIKNADEAPWVVLAKKPTTNHLVVGQGTDHPDLFAKKLTAQSLNWLAGTAPAESFACQARVRYRQDPTQAQVTLVGNTAHVEFQQDQRAITPGQNVVFYNEAVCLGNGQIIETV